MRLQYEEYAAMFKVLSDYNRLMIVDMLSCGELCACNILGKFQITQPTLSHHMNLITTNHNDCICQEDNQLKNPC